MRGSVVQVTWQQVEQRYGIVMMHQHMLFGCLSQALATQYEPETVFASPSLPSIFFLFLSMKQPRREGKLEPYNRHPKHRQSPREELNEWYRNRPVKWDEERQGAFWGYRGRRGARM